MNNKDIGERSAKGILLGVRKKIEKAGLDRSWLPPWASGADIQIGRIPNGTILLFEEGLRGEDTVVDYRETQTDITFFFPNQDDTRQTNTINVGPTAEGAAIVDNSVLTINSDRALTNVGMRDVPQCLIAYDVTVEYEHSPGQVIATQYIPFAIFVSDNILDFDALWNACENNLTDLLLSYHQNV